MRTANSTLLASVIIACLPIVPTALADAVVIATVDKTGPEAQAAGLRTCNVYVVFDSPSDKLLNVGYGITSTNAPTGFYQDPGGSNLAPNAAICSSAGFELLCSDSFVTIGVKDSQGGNTTAVDGDFNTCAFNCLPQPPCNPGGPHVDPGTCGQLVGGWFNSNPSNTQGVPDANMQVLIAQLTVPVGSSISGYTTAFFNTGACNETYGNGMDDNPADNCLGDAAFACFPGCNAAADPVAFCDDDNACTDEVCNPDGSCSHLPNSNPCDDGLFCNGADTCGGGTCSIHTGDPCAGGAECNDCCDETADACICIVGAGCGSPLDTACDNPDFCDGAGACLPNHEPDGAIAPSDNNACTHDICMGGVPTHPPFPEGTPCGSSSDTDCDNPDTCDVMGSCVANNESDGTPCLDDGNECTDDVCGSGVCTHPNSPNGSTCGDVGCSCVNGVCASCITNADCDDGIACTQDTCEAGGSCTVCVYTPIDASCDDDDLCTTDSCNPATGCVNETVDCGPGLSCDPATGCCQSACPADLDGGGGVDAADLAGLLGAWGPNAGHPADFNCDGLINATDLAFLLGAWGPCA